ncbi:polysaccharide deacetylase family protein [Kribbella sp. NPDC056951]|uniref:polysaccharide deacetylase family protein n=1 Tax=Kribbella sp. NPDC056951 TaxID=3345978 RepID=UPI00363737A2
MTKPPGKLLPLVAALLCGAVLAQAAQPSDSPVTASSPAVRTVAAGPLSGSPIAAKPTHQRGPRRQGQSPHTKPAADDWNLTKHGKVLYLTFDDGPHAGWTPQVLQILRRHHAQATFFVLGAEAAKRPDLVEQTRAAGHHIGNHTWDHPMLTHIPAAKMRQEIFSGVKSKCFRPPFRDTNAAVEAAAKANHQRQVLWDVDTNDWKKPGAASIEHAILAGAYPGAIVLMHDGGGNRAQTIAALERALTKLQRQGYKFRALPC